MTREEQTAKILSKYVDDPQGAHLASSALKDVYDGFDRLKALGFFLEADEVIPPAKEWPQWIDGALYDNAQHYKEAQELADRLAAEAKLKAETDQQVEVDPKVEADAKTNNQKGKSATPAAPSQVAKG